MAMPDFVGIGAQKAGTTWLYDMLAQHPSVWLPPMKEVHFFDSLNITPERRAIREDHLGKVANRLARGKLVKGSEGDGQAKADHLRKIMQHGFLTKEWYSAIFDFPDAKGRKTGEITPSYLELGEPELQTLAGMLTKTKFIMIIREPTSRTMSQLRMALARDGGDPFARKRGWEHYVERMKTISRGNYDRAIPLWRKTVGEDRLLIRPFGMVRHTPGALLRDIEDFIGAEHFDGYKDLSEPSHKTKDVVEIPDWVVKAMEEQTAPQKAYLIDAFGEEFYNSTR